MTTRETIRAQARGGIKKVLLVVANGRWFQEKPIIASPLALPFLAAELDGRYDYEILDCNAENLNKEQCVDAMRGSEAQAVLITAAFSQYDRQYRKAAELAKAALPGVITIMGGIHATTCYEHIMMDCNIDYVIMGHAEERLSNFLNAIFQKESLTNFDGICYRENGTVRINPVTSNLVSVTIATPNYEKCDFSAYIEHIRGYPARTVRSLGIMTSFGCPNDCLFCSNKIISGRKVTFRDVNEVIEEIKYLKQKYALEHICFYDDEILSDKQRAKNLFERMIEEELNIKFFLQAAAWQLDEDILDLMVKAGLYDVGISLESGCDRVLHKIMRKPLKKELVPPAVKMCRERGVYVNLNVVIGIPGETWNEIRQTLSFAEGCNADYLQIFIASPFPRTDLYQLAVETNSIPEGYDFFNGKYQGVATGVITTEEFTPWELEVLRAFEWDRINFATEEKRERFCQRFGMTAQELDEYRKKGRLQIKGE